LEILKKHPDIYFCAHKSAAYKEPLSEISPSDIKASLLKADSLIFKNPIPTRSVILRNDIKIRFKSKEYAEDYLYWLEYLYTVGDILFLNVDLAFAFKNEYSPNGYSGNLLIHEIRELKTYKYIYDKKYINLNKYFFCMVFSIMKFAKRCLHNFFRRSF
jgi:hypothetical protein